MNRTRSTLIAALLAATPWLALASDGEVKKIDTAQGKITLKHGELKNLDMPPMTMVFKALPATLLNGLAVGDQVVFEADRKDGAYVVTAIRKK